VMPGSSAVGSGAPPGRLVWLGQSARTTVVTREYPELRHARWMASLGDAIHRPRMLTTVFTAGLKERLWITGPLMLDSGGFTMMMRRDGRLAVADVLSIFRRVAADVVVSLDHPPLPSDVPEVRHRKYERTLENLKYLSADLGHDRLAPVIHGLSLEELKINCAAVRSVVAHPKWVCLGGLVPLLRGSGRRDEKATSMRKAVQEAIGLVRGAFPVSSLHILGVGSPRTIRTAFQSGADSVDSVGWRRAAGFGTIFLPGGTEKFVIDRPRKRATSRKILSTDDIEQLRRCVCPACRNTKHLKRRVSRLAKSYIARAVHNAWVLIDEANQQS
jgi:tRNA-guanine family transglycosylase